MEELKSCQEVVRKGVKGAEKPINKANAEKVPSSA